ncbi:glucosamine-6-phosphate deaminase [Terrabacter aerolatus]|uniref:Glucosamine-6-phosphate deaminase n=1 Tax=Terrabacter aerolatus TaxID=422442 RepID=A0A512D611_9MICO|nr:glucosamine-6-phosphate deaminase [Terrabacter aerolatus]GEO31911.1 glucosamine-6-phosphate deaminase [Terrabacter aerolatus]
MDVGIAESAAQAASIAADLIQRAVRAKPELVLGLATGSSPVGIYDELARRVNDGRISLAAASAFMLDEYVGLSPDHPQAYRSVIDDIFTRKVDIDPARVHGPDGTAKDVEAACIEYEQAIRAAGGTDVQILGIGTDGHIAFNEPTSSLASRTRIKTLTKQTRIDNSRFFGGDLDAVPSHCLTQGIGTIVEARKIILIAAGRGKAEAIRQTVEGPVSARWPATALQHHPDVTVLLDPAAACRLDLADYYREVWANKPAWQLPLGRPSARAEPTTRADVTGTCTDTAGMPPTLHHRGVDST